KNQTDMNYKIFIYNFNLEIKKILTYRWEFWFNFLGNISLVVFISYMIWKNIFESQNITNLNGRTLSELLVYYLFANILSRGLVGSNIGFISRDIYQGDLNRFLLYPVNFLTLKLSHYLATTFFYLAQLLVVLTITSFLA